MFRPLLCHTTSFCDPSLLSLDVRDVCGSDGLVAGRVCCSLSRDIRTVPQELAADSVVSLACGTGGGNGRGGSRTHPGGILLPPHDPHPPRVPRQSPAPSRAAFVDAETVCAVPAARRALATGRWAPEEGRERRQRDLSWQERCATGRTHPCWGPLEESPCCGAASGDVTRTVGVPAVASPSWYVFGTVEMVDEVEGRPMARSWCHRQTLPYPNPKVVSP